MVSYSVERKLDKYGEFGKGSIEGVAGPEAANNAAAACQKGPQIFLNAVLGQPGSYFTLRGVGFNPNMALSITINGRTLSQTVTTDAFGNFVALLSTSGAAPGTYTVVAGGSAARMAPPATAAQPSVAAATFQLDPNASLLAQEGAAPVLSLPPGVLPGGGIAIYLPVVRK